MKKMGRLLSLLLVLLVLTGCGNLGSSAFSAHSSGSKTPKVRTTGVSKSGQYNTILQNGKYRVSPIAGVTANNNNTNGSNQSSFENGLLELSKQQFSTDKYYFQEGNLISAPTAQKWLARKSDQNPQGLNPADNGQSDPEKREPLYLQQLLEQNFYTKTDDGYKLAGITVGLSLNQVDYYTKEKFGSTFETKIDAEKRQAEGQKMAEQIVKYLRKQRQGADVPILVGLYKNNVNDSLVGGDFFSSGVSDRGQDRIGSWKNVSQRNQVLPLINGEKAISGNDSEDFGNFKNDIESYFPNLSGVTAQVHYQEGNLQRMSITITTQFYGAAQISSFTQFVQDEANKYLPQQPAVEIRIQTVQEMQALITKDVNSKQYNSHVLAAY
ncbi:CamS family sex pheromone protein [Lactobacillus sp. DCY120]|uniref:CamS family sex pheromone protein n=1 Tax=Bombilactobacillus apium TaxID=2675299 RepID=A0A850QY04_9LACO|nr:CamS family sex pheromone protein [Bombilactobacillus apium]NVY96714.1 CamS family sex pheromone protein [Bombilactobacillus apium]